MLACELGEPASGIAFIGEGVGFDRAGLSGRFSIADPVGGTVNFSKGANRTRKDFVADQVLSRVAELVHSGTLAPTVGVYRLTTKTGAATSARRACRA